MLAPWYGADGHPCFRTASKTWRLALLGEIAKWLFRFSGDHHLTTPDTSIPADPAPPPPEPSSAAVVAAVVLVSLPPPPPSLPLPLLVDCCLLFVSTTAVAVAATAAAVVAIDAPIAVFVVATPATVTVAVVVAAITVAATAGNAVGKGGGAELMGAIQTSGGRPLRKREFGGDI